VVPLENPIARWLGPAIPDADGQRSICLAAGSNATSYRLLRLSMAYEIMNIKSYGSFARIKAKLCDPSVMQRGGSGYAPPIYMAEYRPSPSPG
jgi:hypothetical protein